MANSYEIIDYSFDVIVLDAGGAGLRATLGKVAAGLNTACITKGVSHPQPHGRGARRASARRSATWRRTICAGTCSTR